MTIRAFLQDRRGSVFAIMGFGFVMAVGISSLAIDMGYLYVLKGKLQSTADFAALAAVSQLPDEDAARTTAIEYSTKNMPIAEHGTVLANTDVVTGNWDQSTRTFTPAGSPTNAVRAVTRRAQANGNAAGLFFASVLGFEQVDITASAVALREVPDEFCMVSLDPSAAGAISLTVDSEIQIDQCGIAANSSSPSSISVTGDSQVQTESLSTVGGIVQGANASISTTDPPETGSSPVVDPFATLNVPAFSGCGGGTNLTITSDTTLSPGVYCGGLHVTNDVDVTLNAGIYIIDGGDLVLDGDSDVQGDEVVIFLTSSGAAADIGSLSITDYSRLKTTAPTSGPYMDMSIFQDRNAPSAGQNIVSGVTSGGSPTELETTGYLYFPAQEFYVGEDGKLESSLDNSGCAKLVAGRITVTDHGQIEIECDDGVLSTALGRMKSRLRL